MVLAQHFVQLYVCIVSHAYLSCSYIPVVCNENSFFMSQMTSWLYIIGGSSQLKGGFIV